MLVKRIYLLFCYYLFILFNRKDKLSLFGFIIKYNKTFYLGFSQKDLPFLIKNYSDNYNVFDVLHNSLIVEDCNSKQNWNIKNDDWEDFLISNICQDRFVFPLDLLFSLYCFQSKNIDNKTLLFLIGTIIEITDFGRSDVNSKNAYNDEITFGFNGNIDVKINNFESFKLLLKKIVEEELFNFTDEDWLFLCNKSLSLRLNNSSSKNKENIFNNSFEKYLIENNKKYQLGLTEKTIALLMFHNNLVNNLSDLNSHPVHFIHNLDIDKINNYIMEFTKNSIIIEQHNIYFRLSDVFFKYIGMPGKSQLIVNNEEIKLYIIEKIKSLSLESFFCSQLLSDYFQNPEDFSAVEYHIFDICIKLNFDFNEILEDKKKNVLMFLVENKNANIISKVLNYNMEIDYDKRDEVNGFRLIDYINAFYPDFWLLKDFNNNKNQDKKHRRAIL